MAEPGDARGQSLEGDVGAREANPALKRGVVREAFQQIGVDGGDVLRVVGQRHPAVRADRLAKERAEEGFGENRDVEGVGDTGAFRLGADEVAVVKDYRAALLQGEHRFDVLFDAGEARCHQLLRAILAPVAHRLQRHPGGDVAVDEVVRRGLVGDDVRGHAARDQFRVNIGGIAAEADGKRLAAGAGGVNQGKRFIERRRLPLQIAVFQALGDARRVGLDDENRRARHHACERLRAAHAAETGGQNEFPGEGIVEMLAGNLHEDFKRALNDALRADVLPGASGQPAPADEAFVLQVVEDFRLRPLPDHIAVRHDDQRRVHVRFHHANRLAGLNQQGFVFRHRL